MLVDKGNGLYQVYLTATCLVRRIRIRYVVPCDRPLEQFFVRHFCLLGYDCRTGRDYEIPK